MLDDEVLGQRQDIAAALAQRRQLDGRHVQAVEQVLAEVSGDHRVSQVDVGRRHQPHVDGDRPARTEPHHLAFLQHAQQLDLDARRQVADLV